MLPGDAKAIEGVKVRGSSMKRVAQFAKPYKWSIIGFLISILVAAVAALVPPLLFRTIVDQAIPEADKRRIVWLTIILVTAAVLDAVLQIIQRWYSARIGEGLIYDLRVALFDKVQNMPIAFFTRTQTGALISRLNNDVVGAQTAVTGTLGSVVSNVVVLGTTLASWCATAGDFARANGFERRHEHTDDRTLQCVGCVVGEAVWSPQR
jgi:ATP-binding cassette subfamily B protein